MCYFGDFHSSIMRGAWRGPITAVLAAWEGPGMGMGHGQPPPPSTAWGAGGAATPVGTKGDPPAILVSETTSFLASSVSVMCKCFVDNCLIINSAPC